MPTKDARLKQPSKEDFDKELLKLDNKINEVREKRKNLQNKRSDI
jgi:peptidoglycan hydrolase CwlO-like protein